MMVTSQRFVISILLLVIGCCCIRWNRTYNGSTAAAVALQMTFPNPTKCSGSQLHMHIPSDHINYEENKSSICTRRCMLVVASTTASLLMPNVATSFDDEVSSSVENIENRTGRPFAPLSALLPAARLKLVVDQMYVLSKTLNTNSNEQGTTIDKQYMILEQMYKLWIHHPPLIQANDSKRLTSSMIGSTLGQITTSVSSGNKQQYRNNRKDLTSIPDQMAAMFNQADVERQWGIIKYQESKLEQQNEVRAALNYYTCQLVFSASTYTLTATAEKRKQMIRNDQLPTPTTVITSDLDLRDLYRNDFLTHIEDAVAEIKYQLNQKSIIERSEKVLDISDVIDLMDQANTALSKWFDLISPIDVKEAIETIKTDFTKTIEDIIAT
jgi:hypothetical protein